MCSRLALSSSFFALALVTLMTGCPGSLSDAARFLDASAGDDDARSTVEESVTSNADGAADGGCPDVGAAVFTPMCAKSGCHATASMAASLDLQAPDIFQRLVGKPASGGAGVLIDPSGNPMKSVLYTKLTASPPFGSQMPLIGPKLDSATLACVGTGITTEAQAASDAGSEDAGADSELDAGPPVDAGPSMDAALPEVGDGAGETGTD